MLKQQIWNNASPLHSVSIFQIAIHEWIIHILPICTVAAQPFRVVGEFSLESRDIFYVNDTLGQSIVRKN